MDSKRLQELNLLLMNNKFDKETYNKLSFEETYAMFRLASIHHAKLTEQIKKALLKNQNKQAQNNALKILLGKANYFYALSIEHIKKLECFYAAYSGYTNAPFVYCDPTSFFDLVWLFTSEEKLNAVIEKQKENHVLLKSVKVNNADFLKFFSKLFYMGIDRLLFDYGTEGMIFTLENICKKPDFEKIENPAAALNNSSLALSTLYFLQESRKPIDHSQKENLPQLEEEMSKNIVSGSYLMPFIKTEATDAPSNYQIPYLKNTNGDLSLPVFTDLLEFEKYNSEKKFNATILPFDKLAAFLGKADGIIFNPTSCCLYLKKEMLPTLLKRFEE